MNHVATPFVKLFGNSVIFGDRVGDVSQIIQPFLFYPDWFFVSWPFHLYWSLISNGHGPYVQGEGITVAGWAIVWYIVGCMLGAFGYNKPFQNLIDKPWPAIILVPYKFFMSFLYWHVFIADMIGTLLTPYQWLGEDLSRAIRFVVYFVIVVPPIVSMIWLTLMIFGVYF